MTIAVGLTLVLIAHRLRLVSARKGEASRWSVAPSLGRQILNLALGQGDLGIIDELVTAGGVTHAMSWGMAAGRVGLKQLIASYRTGFPDLDCTIEHEINEGNRSAVLWTMRGTHSGLFLGNPPTGRRIVVQGVIFVRAETGRIIEDWILVDQMGILQQLGIIPPPRGF